MYSDQTRDRDTNPFRVSSELGPGNRYDVLAGRAFIESYLQNEPLLEELSTQLADLSTRIAYNDDRFDTQVAPIADFIEKMLKKNPYGTEVASVRIHENATLSLWETQSYTGWIRIMSGTWAPNKSIFKKIPSLEKALDNLVQISRLIVEEYEQGAKAAALLFTDRIHHEIGSSIRVYREKTTGATRVIKTFRNHDMGGIRFGYNYYFRSKWAAQKMFETLQKMMSRLE